MLTKGNYSKFPECEIGRLFTFAGLNKPLKIRTRNGSAIRKRQSPAITVVECIFTNT